MAIDAAKGLEAFANAFQEADKALVRRALDVLALDVTGASVAVTGLVNLTVSGELGLARVTPDGDRSAVEPGVPSQRHAAG